MMAEAAILLKDIQGWEKNQGRIGGFLKFSTKAVCRGELLILLPRVEIIPRKDGKPARYNYQLASDPSVTLFCTDDDVAPLSDYEYHLMVAIKSREARFDAFQKKTLEWGSKLKTGMIVYVALPSKGPVSSQRAASVIKYIGPLLNELGTQFGVEIQEQRFRHRGSSDGYFGGQQFFTCEENCALFVSLDQLSPDPQPEMPPSADPQRHRALQHRKQTEKRSNSGTRDVLLVNEQSEDEYLKDALNTTKIDREEQIRLMREIEKAHKEKQQSASRNQPYIDPRNPQDRYDIIPGVSNNLPSQPSYQNPPPYRPPAPSEQHVPPSTGASSTSPRAHAYYSPNEARRDLQKMRDHRSIRDDRLLGPHPGGGGGSSIPLRHQRSMPGPGNADEHHPLYMYQPAPQQQYDLQCFYPNVPRAGGTPQQSPEEWRPGSKPILQQLSERRHSDNRMYNQQNQPVYQGGVPDGRQKFQPPQSQHMHQQQRQGAQQQAMHGGQQLQQQLQSPGQTQPPFNGTHPSGAQLPHGASAVVPPETISHFFLIGSTVQLMSDHPRYGVIQWMGSLPGIDGRIAGVDLEEPMEGCTDGSWNGVRYFNCQTGHGFFSPLSYLAPDQRFAQTATVPDNPLEYVAYEEVRDQFINPGQILAYIGDGKGIQGHQNSCYLDSTVFGLFAASDVFDNIFLEQQAHDPAGDDVKYLLWKGIVNPLRKNGVVRYESVMRLRNKLEELGKMKGVYQDEKDPEEFMNMLFKHTLHVPPFLSIMRPFGVEQEYFVQLFVEHDEFLKLPTVGNLLEIMFKEQKLRFTKVPSKLLIQIPRYGREFKTYQKTIPGVKLELQGLLSSKRHCFICGKSAWKECSECSGNEAVMYFCEKCALLVHGKSSKRDRHVIRDTVPDIGGVTKLDLLSVICIETSHYICFTMSEDRWVFFDSMANRVNDMYNIPKVVDCTDVLNEWVYPANGDLTRLLNTPPRELPEYVRRFTQDIYLCVYIQPDFAVFGDFDDDYLDEVGNNGQELGEFKKIGVDHATLQQELDELKAKYAKSQQQKEEANFQITQLQQEVTQLKVTHQEELTEKEKNEQARHQQELEQFQSRLQQMATDRRTVEQRLLFQESRVQELERKLETANTEAKEVRFTQLLNPQSAESSWNVPRSEVMIKEEIGRGASGLVSKGQFRGQTVAIKQIHQFILTQKHVMDEFKREVRIMASVQHPNLVHFIGAVFDESVENLSATPLLLVELLHTNLRRAYEDQHSNLSASVMLSIFRDMAYGLHYLHEHQEPIIHRDVSAPNVLLEALPGGTWRAKLSDFGSANFLKRSSTLGVGAVVYTAPEMFPREDPTAPMPCPTVKCDIFSYGIVLVEVITKTMPTRENRHQLFQELERKWRMMYDLVTQCIQRRPDDRPTMTVVLNTLNRFPVARPR